MPIDVNVMEQQGSEVTTTIRNSHVQDEVFTFLKKHKKEAFNQKEIGDALGLRPQQVRQCCFALMKKGKVLRKSVSVTTANGKSADIIHWTIVQ